MVEVGTPALPSPASDATTSTKVQHFFKSESFVALHSQFPGHCDTLFPFGQGKEVDGQQHFGARVEEHGEDEHSEQAEAEGEAEEGCGGS